MEGVTRTVLFVEDGAANIRLMERILRRRPGVKMVSAPDGATGLRLLREIQPDLVLLDRNLPDMPGEVILRQVRSDPSLGALPVVVMSGDTLPAVVERAMELGATAYIEKPFDVVEFLRLVDRLLSRGQPA